MAVLVVGFADKVFDVNPDAEDAVGVDKDLSEEHEYAAVYLTLGRQHEADEGDDGSEDEEHQCRYALHHRRPMAEAMAVIVVRRTLMITDHLFLVVSVIVNGCLKPPPSLPQGGGVLAKGVVDEWFWGFSGDASKTPDPRLSPSL